jgi:regulator of cell morphogenesis and NO signaling
MSLDDTQQVSALIDHILSRFHEGHRRAFPALRAMAAEVQAQGIADDLGDALHVMESALEQHMFKEEMRLFPMMEQGGNTLIGHLIDDLHREHVAHQAAMDGLRARLGALAAAHGAAPALQRFILGVDELASELAAHIQAEDDALFPLFAVPPAARPAARDKPGRPR